MKKYSTILAIAIITTFAMYLQSCKKDPPANNGGGNNGTVITPVEMTPYNLVPPAFYPPAEIPEDNKMYEERIALGKMLFFDKRLSNDGSTCESCHQQKYGFGDDKLSVPDKGLTSLPLINLAWYKNFMWNSRIIGSLEDVMFAEVTVRFETDMDKINAIEEYKTMFKQYYDIDNITAEDLAKALAQYMRVLVSADTKYDRYFRGMAQLTASEERGRQIFFREAKSDPNSKENSGGDCFHCHVNVITTDNILHNNGIDSAYAKEIDKGFYNVTKDPKDLGKFRTPTLRNVALRPQYMHDGRFKTLREVIDFYDHGVHAVQNIDPLMTKPEKVDGLNLSEQDKLDLIAFLNTFTDSTMITSEKFK